MQHRRERVAGELRPLVGIDDIRFAVTGDRFVGPFSVPRFSAGDRNTPIAPPSNCVSHCVIWLPCTSYFSANSASVLSPFIAAKATFALNAAVWFRLGLLIALLLCGRYPSP
jgi:hypothetical protein